MLEIDLTWGRTEVALMHRAAATLTPETGLFIGHSHSTQSSNQLLMIWWSRGRSRDGVSANTRIPRQNRLKNEAHSLITSHLLTYLLTYLLTFPRQKIAHNFTKWPWTRRKNNADLYLPNLSEIFLLCTTDYQSESRYLQLFSSYCADRHTLRHTLTHTSTKCIVYRYMVLWGCRAPWCQAEGYVVCKCDPIDNR